jgi:hypothetical protein
MAGRPVYLLISLKPSPRFELRTVAGYSSYKAIRVEARSCNHYCCRKAKSIIYSECVFVAVVIRHAMRMCRIVICFPHLKKGTICGTDY